MQMILNIWNDFQLVMSLASLILVLVRMCRKDRTSAETLERASMRSMSWPTAD